MMPHSVYLLIRLMPLACNNNTVTFPCNLKRFFYCFPPIRDYVVRKIENGPDVLFIDRHLVHEVTSPVAFLGLKNRNIPVLYPERTFATADHNTPTRNQHLPVQDPLSANQLRALEQNAEVAR